VVLLLGACAGANLAGAQIGGTSGQLAKPKTGATVPQVVKPPSAGAAAAGTRARLTGATALVGGRPEVRLRVRMELGWVPSSGVRVYREAAGRKELLHQRTLSDADADRVLEPSLRGRGLWSQAARRTSTDRPLDFRVIRPPSAATRFRQLKTVADALIHLREQPEDDGAKRLAIQQNLSQLATLRSQPPARLSAAALQSGAPAIAGTDRDIQSARGRLMLSALVKSGAAESLGMGARDRNVKAGDRVRYTVVAIPAQGGSEVLLDSAIVVVGADPQPPAPSGVESHQMVDDDGEASGIVALRWDRLDPALEATLLNASYVIERRPARPARTTTGLTRPGDSTRLPGTATDTVWRRVHDKPVMIAAINGDEEPLSFFEDDLDVPGTYEYRIALVDGYDRQSPWTSHTIRVVDWRRPPMPAAPQAELDDDPRDAAGRPMPRTRVTQNLGFGRGTARPKDLSAWASSPFTLAGKASVRVSWTAVDVPQGLAARYRVFRIDTEAANPQPVLVTPQPIEGEELPATPEQDSARVQAGALEKSLASGSALRAVGAAGTSDLPERRARLVRLRDLMRPRRAFTDAGVSTDRHYVYVVRAVYQPSGLESEDVRTAPVAVPTPAPPPAVTGGAYAGFTASEDLGPAQLLPDTVALSRSRAFTAARQGLARPAPAPGRFQRVSGSTGRFAGAKKLRAGATQAPAASSAAPGTPAGITAGIGAPTAPGMTTAAIPTQPLPDLARTAIVPRVPVFPKADLSKLRLNLLRSRDDGGVAVLRWTPVAGLKDVSYKIQRRYGNLDWADVGTTHAGGTTFRDVLPRSMARTYSYRVMAVSRWGIVGPPSAVITAEVPSTVRPGVPNLLAAAPDRIMDRAIRVRIDPNPADESVVTYRILRDGAAVGAVAASAEAELAFVDPGLVPGRSYRYQIVAVTRTGLESGPSRTLAAVPVQLAAAAPSGLTATVEASGVRLSWSAAPGAVSYCVQRRSAPDTPTQILAGGLRGAVTWLDVTAMPGRSYTYEVLATDEFGNVSTAATAGVSVP
jgi:hypothetical protein